MAKQDPRPALTQAQMRELFEVQTRAEMLARGAEFDPIEARFYYRGRFVSALAAVQIMAQHGLSEFWPNLHRLAGVP